MGALYGKPYTGHDYDDLPYESLVPDWSHLSTGDLLRIRYTEGIRLRCTYPRPAFPDYNYKSYIVGVNRVLDARLGVS